MGEKSEPAKAEFFILALWIYWKKYTRGILCWLGLILHQRTCHYHPSSQEVFWLLQQLKHNQVKSKEKLIYNFDFSWSKIVCFFPDFFDYSTALSIMLSEMMSIKIGQHDDYIQENLMVFAACIFVEAKLH